MPLATQVLYLFLLSLPVACISWTVTHEEVFSGFREFCNRQREKRSGGSRLFFYLFTCEYCFSHYVCAAFLLITRYQLIFTDWRGYLIGGFSIVWIANIYMSLFYLLRTGIKKEKTTIEQQQIEMKKEPENSTTNKTSA